MGKKVAKTTTKPKEKNVTVSKKPKKAYEKRGIPTIKTKLYTKTVSALPKYKCKQCGHEWIPRINQPLVCPVCHRKYF